MYRSSVSSSLTQHRRSLRPGRGRSAFVHSDLDLFDDDDPIDGDVTEEVGLYDAGTEENQEPGVGEDQVQHQDGPNTGPTEDEPVRLVSDLDEHYDLPDTEDVIKVTVEPAGGD